LRLSSPMKTLMRRATSSCQDQVGERVCVSLPDAVIDFELQSCDSAPNSRAGMTTQRSYCGCLCPYCSKCGQMNMIWEEGRAIRVMYVA
jgi:hypothetical protein